ncbi:hypothetical protein MZD04_gp377 [Pseudomonas phage Psa21]|uniref:Uncharacterized protein n=1 Tax=Pseudomonas phage Psa21 TaxID=2530023 RepID=A0A481W684_9CAUD|nr:hypothetical protein MZD04_gp377 [Pseudomonas phage Psa21]QBJ02903.1 hypothetical protein PSA21_377 [Pseudomonas phage Psa21]
MSNKTIVETRVETKDAKLARLRKEYILEHWPRFVELFPGMPGYRGDGPFEQKALEILELSKEAQVSITGQNWDPEDLDTLNNRPAKDFIKHIRSNYNRINLGNQWRVVRDQYLLDSRIAA